jgi:hypothetical protein
MDRSRPMRMLYLVVIVVRKLNVTNMLVASVLSTRILCRGVNSYILFFMLAKLIAVVILFASGELFKCINI